MTIPLLHAEPSKPTKVKPLSPELRASLGPPPLYKGEDRAEYDHIYDSLRADVAPRDVVEELYIRDAADYYWEVRRLRRLRVTFLESSRAAGLWRILGYLVSDTQTRIKLHSAWCRGEAEAIEEVASLMRNAGLDEYAIEAQTLGAWIDQIEQIDRLIASAGDRVVGLIREIDRRRSALGARLQGAIQAIDDDEFKQLPPNNDAMMSANDISDAPRGQP